MSELTLKNIQKTFGSVNVIPGLDLTVKSGEFVALVGPSGCGKSTLLRMIAGLENVSGGQMIVDGERIDKVPPQKRGMSMVFQSYALFPHLSVKENIAFGPRTRREDLSDLDARIAKVGEVLNLSDHLEKSPRELSGGQRQRVAMGRAIIRSPKVFLFDEPLSNLDAKLRVAMRAEIRRLHEQLGATTVYVTHDQIEAMTMADRIAVLHGGRLEQYGEPLALYGDPDTKFVAGFMGSPSMNFFPATFVQGDTGPAVEIAGGAQLPCKPRGTTVTMGQPVTAGIRPEHLQVVEAKNERSVPARVVGIEPTGPETFLLLKFDNIDEPFTASVRGPFKPKVGDELHIQNDPAAIQLFDVDSGLRL